MTQVTSILEATTRSAFRPSSRRWRLRPRPGWQLRLLLSGTFCKQVQDRNEVSDRACRACNVVLFGIQDTLGDILTQVLPLTWAKMALHSSTNKVWHAIAG